MLRRLLMPLAPGGMPMAALPNAPQMAALNAPDGQQQQQQSAQGGGGSSQSAPMQMPKRESMIDINQIDGQVRESSIRKVGEVVGSHPEEAMAILRTWLHQPA
jgi:flagellar M-ring protein FliF